MMNIGEVSLEILNECTVDPLSRAVGCCHYINNIQAKIVLYSSGNTDFILWYAPKQVLCQYFMQWNNSICLLKMLSLSFLPNYLGLRSPLAVSDS